VMTTDEHFEADVRGNEQMADVVIRDTAQSVHAMNCSEP
jgi:hypothetical protein